jgi:phosphonate metabolism protein PhnN/1,5-bisphosphokinase (PRPP-forming)
MVCGPSGAGKDSVIGWTQHALVRHPRVRFARRVVTRPAHPASDHEPVSAGEMAALRAQGGLAWHWSAHGCDYGVPVRYAADVALGRVVVVNGSREHAMSLADCEDVRCVLVTAPEPVLRERLRARGREDAAAVAQRIARNGRLPPAAADCVIANTGGLDAAGALLRDYLLRLVR